MKKVSAAHAFTFRKVYTHVKSLPSKDETHPHKVRPPKYGKLCMRYRRIRRALDVSIGSFVMRTCSRVEQVVLLLLLLWVRLRMRHKRQPSLNGYGGNGVER